MKSFAPKPWVAPQPVLIIGTYNKEGIANAMNAAWAGQWDMKEIVISMGKHATTDNLKLNGEFTVAFATKQTMVASDFVGIVSAKNDPKKMEKTGWNIEKATMVDAPVFTDFPMTLWSAASRRNTTKARQDIISLPKSSISLWMRNIWQKMEILTLRKWS